MSEPKFTHEILEDGTKVVTLIKEPKQSPKQQEKHATEPNEK